MEGFRRRIGDAPSCPGRFRGLRTGGSAADGPPGPGQLCVHHRRESPTASRQNQCRQLRHGESRLFSRDANSATTGPLFLRAGFALQSECSHHQRNAGAGLFPERGTDRKTNEIWLSTKQQRIARNCWRGWRRAGCGAQPGTRPGDVCALWSSTPLWSGGCGKKFIELIERGGRHSSGGGLHRQRPRGNGFGRCFWVRSV